MGLPLIAQFRQWQVWHSDVLFFHVVDDATQEQLASFYLDPYTRPENKRVSTSSSTSSSIGGLHLFLISSSGGGRIRNASLTSSLLLILLLSRVAPGLIHWLIGVMYCITNPWSPLWRMAPLLLVMLPLSCPSLRSEVVDSSISNNSSSK